MSIVVDASVLVAALADSGSEGRWADQLIQSETLSAPLLAQVETMNILRRLELAGQIDSQMATAAQRDLMSLEVDLSATGDSRSQSDPSARVHVPISIPYLRLLAPQPAYDQNDA